MKKLVCTFALSAAAVSLSHGTLVSGLTTYWDLDNNMSDSAHGLAGSASAFDDSLTAQGGHSGAFGAGLFGGAGYIGSGPNTGRFEAALTDDLWGSTDNISVSWWGRATNFTTGWQAGVTNGEGNRWRFHRAGNDQTIAWQGGGGDIRDNAVNVNDGSWHHFLGTKDSAGGRVLYIDGDVIATGPAGTALEQGTTPVMIGENADSNGRGWLGDIDDVAIWNRALSQSEVDDIFNAGTAGGALGSLVPEPSTGLLGALAFGLLFIRRKR